MAAAGGEDKPKVEAWRPGAPVVQDRGISGLRAFAADYSGKSGAPALYALVDKVVGSKGQNALQFATEAAHAVEVSGKSFTIKAKNGASLKATVAAPAAAAITAQSVTHTHEINYHGDHRAAPFKRTLIEVKCADYALVVMTLQKGDAPAVQVTGEGPQAVATVGGQTVSFDGKKIVIGR